MKTLVGLSGVGGVADYWTLRRGSGSGCVGPITY